MNGGALIVGITLIIGLIAAGAMVFCHFIGRTEEQEHDQWH